MGVINIGFDFENQCFVFGADEKKLVLTIEEQQLLEIVMGFLSDNIDISMVGIEKRSNDYTSVVYGGLNDFMRFKYTDRTKWVSLRLPFDVAADNMENPLFDAQKNKKQLHWKAKLNSLDDLEALKPYIIASCVP